MKPATNMGGPVEYEITEQTFQRFQELRGRTLTILPTGELQISCPA